MIRDEKTKAAFVAYLAAYPQLRFWQAVRGFWNVPFVFVGDSKDDVHDTFYVEGDEVMFNEPPPWKKKEK